MFICHGKEIKMELFKVDINYCNYLHYYEPKIPYIEDEKENRPFIGVVLNVNGKNFFAPLTSPKRKHLIMKDMQDFLKIDGGRLGGINLNNMMPIPRRYLEKIDLKNLEDFKYKNMLKNQIRWINQNELRIHNRARNLYYLISNGHTTKELLRRCCDFRLLERKCDDYMIENEVNEEEILYCYFYA